MPAKRRQVTIYGLGLIGGSLGLAIRASGLGWEVVGHNRSHESTGKAKKMGAIDRGEWNLPRALDGADLVVLAVAPRAMEKALAEIAPSLTPGTVVTDVASTKVEVLALADRVLPPGVHFVGGHPMAGKELSGIDAADAGLFRGAVYCILPGERCGPEAVELVERMVAAIGARPYYLDPAEHDSYVAAVSHLPFVAASALVGAVARSPSWRDMARVAAGGFRDTTRTASADVVMHRDICLTNREAIARWLDEYRAELGRVREMVLDGDADALEQFFLDAKIARDKWLEGRVEPEEGPALPPLPTVRDGIQSMFFGKRGGKK